MKQTSEQRSATAQSSNTSLKQFVKHYTNLTTVLDIVKNKRLTILNPKNWDDTNDAHYMELYRRNIEKGSVLALCFTMARELYHHWKVFAPGTAGICIEFDRPELERRLPSHGALADRSIMKA